MQLYTEAESVDGYLRDGCVFKNDIDIWDTMSATVRYSNNVLMSYSLNTFMPIEGYHLAFNGTKGRLEVRDYERQPWEAAEDSDIALIRNFGKREKIEVPKADGGHGGGDSRLQDLIFKKIDAPAHLRLPDSRAGAMSCLTGIAARKSVIEQQAGEDRRSRSRSRRRGAPGPRWSGGGERNARGRRVGVGELKAG